MRLSTQHRSSRIHPLGSEGLRAAVRRIGGAHGLRAAAVVGLVACTSCAPAGLPEGWSDAVRLPEATDLSADDGVVEVALDARPASLSILPGTTTPLYTYDGGVPGPLVRAKVGDELRVHFTNHLDEATTVHWHGVRVPNDMDGAPGVQAPVEPGGAFEYAFQLPDPGLYWYHPHFDSTVQVGWGLYGPLLVEDPDDPLAGVDELVLVLSDLAIEADGSLIPPDTGGAAGALFGHEGEVILVNGKRRPTIEVRQGHTLRLRLLDAAKSRYFQLVLDGHRFTEVGGDGGLFEAPVETDAVLLATGERRDVLLTPDAAPGETLAVRWVPFDRGYGSTEFREPEDLFYLRVADLPAETPTPAPSSLRAVEPLDLAAAMDLELALTMDTSGDAPLLVVNGLPSWEASPLPAVVGETRLVTVVNDTDWAHPFHLHGFFFQAVDEAGGREVPARWRDTVSVPQKQASRFLVRFDDRPGMWMFHCHILDHVDLGMMGMFHLQP